MIVDREIARSIELLTLCQQLQSEKDGIVRPSPGQFDKSKTVDQFAMDISTAITHMEWFNQIFPVYVRLGDLGKRLANQGILHVNMGEDHAQAVLRYLTEEFGITQSSALRSKTAGHEAGHQY